jgi:Protein of unknown function (DUF992)
LKIRPESGNLIAASALTLVNLGEIIMKIRQLARLAICAASAAVLALPAAAQGTQIEVGTLTCSGAGGIGMIVGSRKSFSCSFRSANDGFRERYAATITRYGLDLGITGPTTIVWTVLAAERRLQRRALAGNYTGASADASVVIGGGANLLVGGSKRSIALQPLSVQGQSGINIAIGVSGLRLR